MTKHVELEICLDTIAEVIMANGLPVKRIELCAGLDVGGLTPSLGFIQEATLHCNKEVHVMIRPRGGGFHYSDQEKRIMLQTAKWVCEKDIGGIVFGALRDKDVLDIEFSREIIEIASNYGKETTFHRAIDFSADPLHTLQGLIDLGCTRILTSGAKESAYDGIDLIQKMVEKANGKIQIMAGAGINSENAVTLAETGVTALHFTSNQKKPTDILDEMGEAMIPYPDKAWAIIDTLRENNLVP